MNMDNNLIAVIIGIVEGVTEFLPVSSTGHMIIVGNMLGFDGPFLFTKNALHAFLQKKAGSLIKGSAYGMWQPELYR